MDRREIDGKKMERKPRLKKTWMKRNIYKESLIGKDSSQTVQVDDPGEGFGRHDMRRKR